MNELNYAGLGVFFWQYHKKFVCYRYEYEFTDNYVRPWRSFFPDQVEVIFLIMYIQANRIVLPRLVLMSF